MIIIGEKSFHPSLFAERLYVFLNQNPSSWKSRPKLDSKNAGVNFELGFGNYHVNYSEESGKLSVCAGVEFYIDEELKDISWKKEVIKPVLEKELFSGNSLKNTRGCFRKHYDFLTFQQIQMDLTDHVKIEVSSIIHPIPLGSNNHLSENLEKAVKTALIKPIYNCLNNLYCK